MQPRHLHAYHHDQALSPPGLNRNALRVDPLVQVYKESPLGVRVPLKPPSDPEPPVPPCWEDSQLLEQRRHLEAPDAILMAQITQTLHHFCKAEMAASCQSSHLPLRVQAVLALRYVWCRCPGAVTLRTGSSSV